MNNENNPSRVVIDLDGSLDELDDDDITLPDLASTPDTPIIETPRVEQPEPEEVIPALSTEPKLQPTVTVAPTPTEATRPQSAELQQATEESEGRRKGSWFSRMKSGLTKSRKNLAEGVANILIGGKEIDDELLEEVEDQLLVADIGVEATDKIIKSLTEQTARGDLIYSHSLYKALQKELVEILEPKVEPLIIDTTKKPFVILVVGVNGVGKTTTIGKLAKTLTSRR